LSSIFLELNILFFCSSRRRYTRFSRDWSSDVCSSDLVAGGVRAEPVGLRLDRARAVAGARLVEGHARDGEACEDVIAVDADAGEIGRASCRERVWVSVVAGS